MKDEKPNVVIQTTFDIDFETASEEAEGTL